MGLAFDSRSISYVVEEYTRGASLRVPLILIDGVSSCKSKNSNGLSTMMVNVVQVLSNATCSDYANLGV